MADPSHAMEAYIAAKDTGRPWLASRVFAPDAVLEIRGNSEAVVLPASAAGCDAIAGILVRQFTSVHENVYTFFLSAPPPAGCREFSCDWLVGMSRRDSGELRVGCGRYDWSFVADPETVADHLRITIDVMAVLPPTDLQTVMAWLSRLPHPWCAAGAALTRAPHLSGLRPVLDFLARRSPAAVADSA